MTIKSVSRSAEMVRYDAIRLIAHNLCRRYECALLKQPRSYIGFLRPFVQRHIAIPNPMDGLALVGLGDSTAKWVVLELYGLAIGTLDASEHTVALPFIGPIALLPLWS